MSLFGRNRITGALREVKDVAAGVLLSNPESTSATKCLGPSTYLGNFVYQLCPMVFMGTCVFALTYCKRKAHHKAREYVTNKETSCTLYAYKSPSAGILDYTARRIRWLKLTTELQALTGPFSRSTWLTARAAANGADDETLDRLDDLSKEERVKQAIVLIVEQEIALPTAEDEMHGLKDLENGQTRSSLGNGRIAVIEQGELLKACEPLDIRLEVIHEFVNEHRFWHEMLWIHTCKGWVSTAELIPGEGKMMKPFDMRKSDVILKGALVKISMFFYFPMTLVLT